MVILESDPGIGRISTSVRTWPLTDIRINGLGSLRSLSNPSGYGCFNFWGIFDMTLRCCQSNANPSPLFADEQVLSHEKVAPLAKGGVAFLFKSNSGVNMPFEVEVIVH